MKSIMPILWLLRFRPFGTFWYQRINFCFSPNVIGIVWINAFADTKFILHEIHVGYKLFEKSERKVGNWWWLLFQLLLVGEYDGGYGNPKTRGGGITCFILFWLFTYLVVFGYGYLVVTVWYLVKGNLFALRSRYRHGAKCPPYHHIASA